ncbi:MAG: phenylalanine--tRNA ligase subunit beta [Bryobacteraceae bacterium]
MKFSYNWIRELVEGVDATPQELSRLITMKTAESEGVEAYGEHLNAVCAARVIAAEPIAGSHNLKAVVETGRYGAKTVVCGAPNCRAGMVTAYVPAGTRLGGKEIRKATIAGVESDGMLASGAELGIHHGHEGILEIEAEPGAALPGCEPDSIIEIDNKSLTHRPDLWGHHGMAREVAAILRRPLREPVDLCRIPEGAGAVRVEVEDLELCPRYSALVVENVRVMPSPLWMQYRLEAIGLNPINNVVDVTNYVMAELAQPMHAFDAEKIEGDTIHARRARPGERITALNEESYTLEPHHLVIADGRGPIALAGVIGGLESAIGEGTTRIVLESANFDAATIRKTSAQLRLRTDASMRFEKSQDPVNTVRALARAVELLEMVSPGIRVVGGLADRKREVPAPAPIELEIGWLARKLGRVLPAGEVREILEALEFGVKELPGDVLSVTAPSWRATKDISIKDDLVEEVGRIIGYDSITPTAPLVPAAVPPANEERNYLHAVREMAAAQGFTEVYNYSFISDELARRFGFDPEAHVRVANPIASDQTLMRMSLVPGICKNIEDNSRHFESFRLFEIGREIHKRPEGLPEEVPHLAAAVFERHGSGEAGLFELKRLAECLMPGAEVRPAPARPFEHPARAAEVCWENAAVGRLFELHPSLVSGRAAVLDVDLQAVQAVAPKKKKYTPLRRYPSSAFDLSVVVGLRDLVGEIQGRLRELAGKDLESIEFLRQYAGAPLPEDRKSVSFRLTVGAPDRTLSSDDVSAIRGRIIEGMRSAGYELRV